MTLGACRELRSQKDHSTVLIPHALRGLVQIRARDAIQVILAHRKRGESLHSFVRHDIFHR